MKCIQKNIAAAENKKIKAKLILTIVICTYQTKNRKEIMK